MKSKRILQGIVVISVFILVLVAASSVFAADIIHVKFKESAAIEQPMNLLTPSISNSVDSIARLFSLSEDELDNLRVDNSLPDLNLWFKIRLKSDVNTINFLKELKLLNSVEEAEIEPLPSPPPAVTPDFTGDQGYLDPAADGIDADYAWTIPGGNGSGIFIYDIEYNWLQTHEDLSKASTFTLLMDAGDTISPPGYPATSTRPACPAPCDSINREHGTAVLGELIADNDTKGVTGISWGADIRLAPVRTTNRGYDLANAIVLATNDALPGDVILIEQQATVCGLGLGPSEESTAVFNAIETAIANDMIVVEAAGNGGIDLDDPACGTTFDRTVQDSAENRRVLIILNAVFHHLLATALMSKDGEQLL